MRIEQLEDKGVNYTRYVTCGMDEELEKLLEIEARDNLAFLKPTEQDIKDAVQRGIEEFDPIAPIYQATSEEQREYMRLYSQLRGINNIGILDAHGTTRGDEWFFNDGKMSRSVQKWINSVEEKHDSLLLCVCNDQIGIHTPESKKAIVVYPLSRLSLRLTGSVSEQNSPDGFGMFEMYVPKIKGIRSEGGVVDDYTIDYEIRELRKKLEANK